MLRSAANGDIHFSSYIPADYDGNLYPDVVNFLYLPGHLTQHFFIQAKFIFSGQGLSADLQNDSFIFWASEPKYVSES